MRGDDPITTPSYRKTILILMDIRQQPKFALMGAHPHLFFHQPPVKIVDARKRMPRVPHQDIPSCSATL